MKVNKDPVVSWNGCYNFIKIDVKNDNNLGIKKHLGGN